MVLLAAFDFDDVWSIWFTILTVEPFLDRALEVGVLGVFGVVVFFWGRLLLWLICCLLSWSRWIYKSGCLRGIVCTFPRIDNPAGTICAILVVSCSMCGGPIDI